MSARVRLRPNRDNIVHSAVADIHSGMQVEELTRIGVYGEESRFGDHEKQAIELEERGDVSFWEGMQASPNPETLDPHCLGSKP